MEAYAGLIELVLVFSLLLGWGTWELFSLRRQRKRNERRPDKVDEGNPR
ncbi:MAG: hypothetical protein R3D62_18155 [Xanthobacteraceae bacterium]